MKKPLIEKYLTYIRVHDESTRARIKREEREEHFDGPGLNYNLVLLNSYTSTYSHMAESAQKYRLARSGQAMVDALRPQPLLRGEFDHKALLDVADHKRALDPDIETPIAQIPGSPIWIELSEPIVTNNSDIAAMFFTCAARELEYQLTLPQTRSMRAMIEESLESHRAVNDFHWSLHFIDSNGTPKSLYEYHEEAQRWAIIPNVEPCPTDECVTEEYKDAEGFTQYTVIPCPFCASVLAYWRSWFVTALLTCSGEFAATEEVDWPVQTQEVVRKVQRPRSAKFDEIKVRHDYYLVAFDASVKKHYRFPPEVEEEERQVRGSWLEAAREIDPESVIYVRRGFGATERVLDPARNPRWKEKRTVPVRGHERHVPIKVNTLQKKITLVVASKYQQEGE